jgi:TonB family protein
MPDDVLFLDVFSNQSPLIKRLAAEFRAAARDFTTDPAGYIAAVFKDHRAGQARRKDLLRFGMAIGLFVYATLFAAMLLVWALHARHNAGADKNRDLTIVHLPALPASDTPLARADRDKDETGGGGGGRHELTLASQGVPPPFEPEMPLIAPTTRPTLHEPSLPVMETLRGDPLLNDKRDLLAPTGLPNGVPGPPSDGPGANGGVGTGDKGGLGPGEGPGLGPGRNGGKGGDDYTGPASRRQPDAPSKVDAPPRALNAPRPNYTEEARSNKVQGVVRARILVGSDGTVQQVRISKGLPYGLNEEAIRAAMQMRFRPAMKDGVAVAYWMALDVEFNLR